MFPFLSFLFFIYLPHVIYSLNSSVTYSVINLSSLQIPVRKCYVLLYVFMSASRNLIY